MGNLYTPAYLYCRGKSNTFPLGYPTPNLFPTAYSTRTFDGMVMEGGRARCTTEATWTVRRRKEQDATGVNLKENGTVYVAVRGRRWYIRLQRQPSSEANYQIHRREFYSYTSTRLRWRFPAQAVYKNPVEVSLLPSPLVICPLKRSFCCPCSWRPYWTVPFAVPGCEIPDEAFLLLSMLKKSPLKRSFSCPFSCSCF